MNIKNLISKAKKAGADQAEIFYSKTTATSIDVLNQEIESVDSLITCGIGIRVIKDKRLGFAYTSNFDHIEDALQNAIANARDTYPDEFNLLPTHNKIPPLKENIYDNKLKKINTLQKIEFALNIESSAYAYDKRIKKTDKVSFTDSEFEIQIANTSGLHASFKGTHCGAYADVIAEQDNEAESGFGFESDIFYRKMNPQKIGEEASLRAIESLGAAPIPSQKITIILDPRVAAQILGIISGIVSAEAVQKGRSLFAQKLGEKVASPILTIYDDGRLKGAIGSAPFDGEGIPTQTTIVIENGILNSYLYNHYSALKDGVKSTGNAARSYSSTPQIGPTNMYIKPGNQTKSELVKSFTSSLYITRLMGIHTINPISGDFSVGAVGSLLKNGEKIQSVRGITIAGNLIQLLNQIEIIGSDLRFFGNIAAPTLAISNISIGG